MNSFSDCASYILFKILSFVIRPLPPPAALWLGRRVGDAVFFCDYRHRARVYAGLKTAFGGGRSPRMRMRLTHDFYRAFGQNVMDIFLVRRVDKEYLKRYITIEGGEHIEEAFKRGKGIIFLGVHEGSWEMYNCIAAGLGVPFNLLVREQKKFGRIAGLLNSYRRMHGCRIIVRESQTRGIIAALRRNEAVGMSLDQGGASGIPVSFFGKQASMSTGAVRLALKYGASVVVTYFIRERGPQCRIILEPPFELAVTGDQQEDVRCNVRRLTERFEFFIRRFPREYLWTYKIWKYSKEKTALVISDGKTGHLRQSEAIAEYVRDYWRSQGIDVRVEKKEAVFRAPSSSRLLRLSCLFAGKYSCQGCLWCLRRFLEEESYAGLMSVKADVIISSGASLAPITYLLAQQNNARSIVGMRPSLAGIGKFDLAVIPRHDMPRPGKNIVITEGALNLVTEEYIKAQTAELLVSRGGQLVDGDSYIGLMIGGSSRQFTFTRELAREVISRLKRAALDCGAGLLVTTSRRTPADVESEIKESLGRDALCKLLIIANENNIPSGAGGILGLSSVVVISPESISMISEAAGSGRHVVVFDAPGLSRKHRRFLEYCAGKGYIYVVTPRGLGAMITDIAKRRPPATALDNRCVVRQALAKIL